MGQSVELRERRGSVQAKGWAEQWRLITEQEARTEYRAWGVVAFSWAIMISHQIRLSINHKEAIYIIQNTSKIKGTVTQTMSQGEMAQDFLARQDMEMVKYLHSTDKMLQNTVKKQRR